MAPDHDRDTRSEREPEQRLAVPLGAALKPPPEGDDQDAEHREPGTTGAVERAGEHKGRDADTEQQHGGDLVGGGEAWSARVRQGGTGQQQIRCYTPDPEALHRSGAQRNRSGTGEKE